MGYDKIKHLVDDLPDPSSSGKEHKCNTVQDKKADKIGE